MTPQIKNRIEQIRRGEVPEGYKRTKVGIVPKEWEQSRLTQYLTVSNEKNADLKYGKEDVFSISGDLGIVNQIELLGRSYAGVSVAPYGVVYPNDIVYTKSPLKANPYGIIKTNLTGKIGLVSTLYAVYHPTNKVCPLFVNYYFGHDKKLNDYLHPIVNIGAKHDMKISDENALKGYVAFPPLPEQEKIAEILTAQDRVIALLDQKIEQLQKMKKVFLQKMFPAKGQTVPEWRFKGFSGDWEQRKVGDVLFERNVQHPQNDEYPLVSFTVENGVTPKTERYDREQLIKGEKCQKKYKETRLDDIVYNPANLKFGAIARNKYGNAVFSPIYVTYEVNKSIAIPSFVEMNVTRDSFIQNALQYQQGTVYERMSVNTEDFAALDIALPSKEEQLRIGECFSNLDNIITLHLRKRDEEKQKKKALMQLLLTGIVRVK